MEDMEVALQQPKEEVHSPPLSDDDVDSTEPDDTDGSSDGSEEEGGARAGPGGAVASGGPPLKKGPWTPDEDRRLKAYVEKHGEGNWNQVQRNAGLNRCGKSCRLRWANHLRPHLKKGPFSPEEEQTIIEQHALHGNKWAQMAAKLPGRTDNEIKNFWNTRSKRRQKAGKGLYPDGLLSRLQNKDMDSGTPDDLHGNKQPNEISQRHNLEFTHIIFEKLDYKKRPENFLAPVLLDGMNPLKRHASSDMVSGYGGSPTCEQFAHEPERTCYTDTNPGITKNYSVPSNNAIHNGLPVLDVNFSTPGTIQRPIKRELPSLQNAGVETVNSWPYHIVPATPLDLADSSISSPASVLMNSDGFPSQNNGLLDAMGQQGQILGDPTNIQGAYEVLIPPVAFVYPPHSSVFDDNLLESSPLDEYRTSKSPASLDALLADSKNQAEDIFPDKYLLPLPDFCWPGASADASYLNEDSPHSEHQPINDQIGAFFGGYPCDEDFLSAPGDGHQHRLESVLWNSMPDARHVPGS